MSTASNVNDLTIMGGGVAGLTLALQLRRALPQSKITLLEKSKYPLEDSPIKVGESTVEISAHYFIEVLKLKEHFDERQLPKLGLRYFFTKDGNKEIDKRVELGSNRFMPRRTYQIDRERFESFLAEQCVKEGVEFIDQALVDDFTINKDGSPHSVTYRKDGQQITMQTRWLVDSTGRTSLIQRDQNLKEECAHNINAVWFRIEDKINVDDWSSDPTYNAENKEPYSRWYSTNHLMGEGYWVWLIPLSRGSTSVGIVADPRCHPLDTMNSFEKSIEWLNKYEPQCGAEVEKRKHLLQDFLALKKFSKRSKQVFSSNRWAITGDAGVFIDPLYSPGMDYISLANTFITDFVVRDLNGGRVGELIKLYNELFLQFSDNTFQVYQDMYPVFKNPQLTTLKIVWDFSVYWSFLAFLCNQDRMCEIKLLAKFSKDLQFVKEMHRGMQAFFRSWNEFPEPQLDRTFIDFTKIEYIYKLDECLLASFNDESFEKKLASNFAELEKLAAEIVGAAQIAHPGIAWPSFLKQDTPTDNKLGDVFEKLNMVSPCLTESRKIA